MTRKELLSKLLYLASDALEEPETTTATGVLLALATAVFAGSEEALLHAVVPSMVEMQRKAEQGQAQNN